MAKKIKFKNGGSYDAQSDVLYLGAKRGLEEEYVEVSPGVHVELDNRGRVIGVEILNASQVLRSMAKSRQTIRQIKSRELARA